MGSSSLRSPSKFSNRDKIVCMVFTSPFYATAKQLQWKFPDIQGKTCMLQWWRICPSKTGTVGGEVKSGIWVGICLVYGRDVHIWKSIANPGWEKNQTRSLCPSVVISNFVISMTRGILNLGLIYPQSMLAGCQVLSRSCSVAHNPACHVQLIPQGQLRYTAICS